jgi:hypothetical protein
LAADLLAELAQIEARLTTLKAELKQAVLARGSDLMNIYGIGPAGAARILADVGDIARFPDRNHFASWTGTAPIDASSGEQIRHRLSRAGNRRLNHVLYMAAFVPMTARTGSTRRPEMYACPVVRISSQPRASTIGLQRSRLRPRLPRSPHRPNANASPRLIPREPETDASAAPAELPIRPPKDSVVMTAAAS